MNFKVLKLHANTATTGYHFPTKKTIKSRVSFLKNSKQKIFTGSFKLYMFHMIQNFCLDQQL